MLTIPELSASQLAMYSCASERVSIRCVLQDILPSPLQWFTKVLGFNR